MTIVETILRKARVLQNESYEKDLAAVKTSPQWLKNHQKISFSFFHFLKLDLNFAPKKNDYDFVAQKLKFFENETF